MKFYMYCNDKIEKPFLTQTILFPNLPSTILIDLSRNRNYFSI